MQYIIHAPQHINATIQLPPSKSISNRALIIHALSQGQILPDNLSDCDDTIVMLKTLAQMPEVIDIKAAGTAMRFMTAFLSVTRGEHVLTGTERMKLRPIGVLVEALRYLGAEITYEGEEGYPPLRIKGRPIEGGHLEVPGNISSQFISALLMIGPVLQKGLELKLTDQIISRPYIELTLWTMREFGAIAEWTDVDTITVEPKPYAQRHYLIENDWTASSYWYEILALRADPDSSLQLAGLMDGSKQGDSVVRYIFSLLGLKTVFKDKMQGVPTEVSLRCNPCTLSRLDYDFINSPDLAQTLIACCVGMDIPFRLTGLRSLKIKETDRMIAMRNELRKLGFVLHDQDDDILIWDGERCEATMEPIDTYEDHRMAMAFSPLAIRFPGLRINDPHVVTKSYPNFWNDLRAAGFSITE